MDFDFLVPIFVVFFMSATTYLIFELFARRRERLALIEKLTEIRSEDLDKSRASIFTNYGLPSVRFSFLRVGMLILGVGLGIIVGFTILALILGRPYLDGDYNNYNLTSVVYGACICFFGGAMLVGSYFLEKALQKHYKNED